MSSFPWAVSASKRAYRLMLWAYPPTFRRQYGPQMAQVFGDCCHDAYRQNGLAALFQLWMLTLSDLAINAIQERLDAATASLAALSVTSPLSSGARRNTMTVGFPTNDRAFGERLARFLSADPTYYQVLVASDPPRRMGELIDSLVLDGDPSDLAATVQLFQELCDAIPEAQAKRWLADLADAAQRLYRSSRPPARASVTQRLFHVIAANPELYELVAAAEPGYGLIELVENLALEGDVDDIEPMLHLMRQLEGESRYADPE